MTNDFLGSSAPMDFAPLQTQVLLKIYHSALRDGENNVEKSYGQSNFWRAQLIDSYKS